MESGFVWVIVVNVVIVVRGEKDQVCRIWSSSCKQACNPQKLMAGP
jgi:hypothetical protein